MKTSPFLTTRGRVSRLGLGTVKFGRNEVVKYPTAFDLPSDSEILDLLEIAREEGINLLDTAPAYGTSEERIGTLLGSRRDDWFLMSKAGEEFEDGVSYFDFSAEWITSSVERSLVRLRTDRLDCVLIHSDGNDREILENSGAVEALARLKEQGKILSHGISTKTVEGGRRAVTLGLDAVMATYHPWHREEEPVLDAAAESGTAVFVKKALASGWFGGAEDEEGDPVEKSFSFVFSHPGTTAAIVGTINPDHLRANCAALRKAG